MCAGSAVSIRDLHETMIGHTDATVTDNEESTCIGCVGADCAVQLKHIHAAGHHMHISASVLPQQCARCTLANGVMPEHGRLNKVGIMAAQQYLQCT